MGAYTHNNNELEMATTSGGGRGVGSTELKLGNNKDAHLQLASSKKRRDEKEHCLVFLFQILSSTSLLLRITEPTAINTQLVRFFFA